MDIINLNLTSSEFEKKYSRKKTIATYTLGCKVNQYETIALEEIFVTNGYELTDFENIADVYLVNTCTVTGMSEKKCRQIIRRCKKTNPYSRVVVSGCYSQKEPHKILEIDGVNLVFGTNNRNLILKEVENIDHSAKKITVDNIMQVKTFEELKVKGAGDRARAFIKVQDGCNRYCSYCIIPYTRGPIRSRNLESIVEEVENLIENGYKEIVLTGIHIASYGKEKNEGSFENLVEVVSKIKGLNRLRTSSMEPLVITEKFMNMLKTLDNFCPHFHLSLQSGSNSVLKRMNRRYTAQEYEEAIKKIRLVFPNAAITTDVIVGFPDETEEEFLETKTFLEKIDLYEMHIFKFSPREGTPAATMKNQINAQTKQKRSDLLLEISRKNKLQFNTNMIGKTLSVLFENKENGYNMGHTMNYVTVHVSSKENLSKNIFNVKIVEANENYVTGILI